jgi:transposase
MVIKRRKKANGRVYLEEYKSVRVDGKVKSIYVRSLGPEYPVEPKKSKRRIIDRLEPSQSYRAGDVTILWNLANDLDFVNIIDGICCEEKNIDGPSPGKLITAWAINRVLDPTSATKLERWIKTPDLPRLMDIDPIDFTKEAFLSSLDFICYEDKWTDGIQDNTRKIEDALYRRWRELYPLEDGENEVLAYDITTILFFGVSCPLAELGYNPNKIKRKLVNMALIVSRKEKYPLLHIIHNGSKNGKPAIKNLIMALQESCLESGTLIWDRGNVSKDNIVDAESAHWKIICGIPKTSTKVRDILKDNTVDCSWNTLVRSSKAGHIYASKVKDDLYGKERNLILYTNRERGIKDANSRNEALSLINDALIDLEEK